MRCVSRASFGVLLSWERWPKHAHFIRFDVVVGDQHGIDGVCIPAMPGKPLLNLAAADPGVEEQLHAIGFDVDAISIAAGLERNEPHKKIVPQGHGSWKSEIIYGKSRGRGDDLRPLILWL